MAQRGQDVEPGAAVPLDAKTSHEWHELAGQVLQARQDARCSRINMTLQAALEREPQSPVAPAYALWAADNFVRDGASREAIDAYDRTVACAGSAARMAVAADPVYSALLHKAQACALLGDTAVAMRTYRELAFDGPRGWEGWLQAGLLAERVGAVSEAESDYRKAAGSAVSTRTDDPRELARRSLLRLGVPDSAFASSADDVARVLHGALDRRDTNALRTAMSTTHFAIGNVGGHTRFETPELLEELLRDLNVSEVHVRRPLLGSGDKRYLHTTGWNGTWFRGDVIFLITRAPRGWECSGVAIQHPSERWVERWRPAHLMTNDPLPFELYAPWPEGQCFKAGGLWEFVGQQAAVIAAGFLGGAILAFAFSENCCGFGPRGFYYNQGSTHDEEDAFAIDFTRYRRWVPYDNESGGTRVLAARSGVVAFVNAGSSNGNSTTSNTVEIVHEDPANPADVNRFRTRYLHLEGPWRIPVSAMMPVYTGNHLGFMDDTGNSVLDHLHFSIHDRNLPHPNSPYGASVRPTPMSGRRLEDGDSGACVRSTNTEYVGAKPMIQVSSYAGQNWLITPAARALNETPPSRPEDQLFLLVLTGVAIVDVKGNSGAQWKHETVHLFPDLVGPLTYAANKYGIATPAGTGGSNWWAGFQVEQWAPFAALSSVFNRNEAVNSGHAVDVWRPHPFWTGTDSGNVSRSNLFAGIQVDVAVRDTDAFIHRVSYHITLLGRMVFGPIVIT